MNPILEAIPTRRSIRAYEARPVTRDLLTTIIDAASQAPSGIGVTAQKKLVVRFFRVGAEWHWLAWKCPELSRRAIDVEGFPEAGGPSRPKERGELSPGLRGSFPSAFRSRGRATLIQFEFSVRTPKTVEGYRL